MTVVRTRTPSGEAIVILPEAEFERLLSLAEDSRDAHILAVSSARLDEGAEELLSEADLDALRDASTPLAFWRERRGVGASELAELGGIPETLLVSVERGESKADIDVYRRLADALGVDLDDILPRAEAA